MAIKYCDFTTGIDFSPLTAWATATSYVIGNQRKGLTAPYTRIAYNCISAHTSAAADQPGVGANWATYWEIIGDGTNTLPLKTITNASTALTGGDEVRVAKSPAVTNLTGTLGFTLGSTAVTGVNTLFTSELAIGDFIKGGDEQWYEVITLTSDTAAVLYKPYSGSTGAGVSSQKLGITSTGASTASSTVIQEVSVSGVSNASRLKISGGWTLATTTQDGQTYFRQMHGTFNNRYGYGLYLTGKSYVEIERCHFLRYNYGIYVYTYSNNNIITTPTCNSNNYFGIYLSNRCSNNVITTPTCNSNSYNYGIYVNNSSNNIITAPICNSNNHGIYLDVSSNCVITNPICNSNYTNGIYLYNNHNCVITNPTCNNNSYGIYGYLCSNNIANKFSGTGNSTADVRVDPARHFGDYPCLKCQQYQTTVGDNRCFYEHGETYRDTVGARSTQCLKYDPNSAAYYISQSFFFKADSGVAQTLSAWVKKEAAFNGDVQGSIYFMGVEITTWTDITPTTNDTYEQKSLVAAAIDISEDGVLEFRIKCRATAGNIFIDDLGTA